MSQVYFKEYIDEGFPEHRPSKDVKKVTLRGYINGIICEFPCLIDARWFTQDVKPDKALADVFAKRAEYFITTVLQNA